MTLHIGALELQDAVCGNHHTLRLSGELDLCSAPELRDLLLRLCGEGTRAITLDLRNLQFMDSSGLHAILRTKELCREHGYEFSVIPGPTAIQRLFELTGLLDELPFRANHSVA
jgi:anti-sigma B factor antagonist